MKDDRLITAGLIGGLSPIAAEIVSRIFLAAGIAKYSFYQFYSLMVTITERPSIVMGFIITFMIFSSVSALIFVILRKWGYNYIIIKSIVTGFFIWLIWEFLFTVNIEGKTIPIRPVSAYYAHLVCTLVLMALMGLLMKRFVFKQPILNQQ